jgi:hypothetical protein
MVGFFFPPPGRVTTPVTATYVTTRSSTSDSPDYIINSVDIGTAAANRIVLCFISQRDGGQLGAGGLEMDTGSGMVDANQLTPSGDSEEPNTTGGWYWLAVPTGTQINMEAHFDPAGSNFSFCMFVYAIYGGSLSPVHYHASGVSSDAGSISSPSMSVPAGGAVISAYATYGTQPAVAWTSATERNDLQVDNDIRASCADTVLASENAAYTVSAAFSGSNSRVLQTVVWPPE